MKKLSLSQIAGLSCMIFAIFFGAGNMIFPPAIDVYKRQGVFSSSIQRISHLYVQLN